MTRLALTWVCGCVTIALALNGPTVTVTGEREEQCGVCPSGKPVEYRFPESRVSICFAYSR